MRELALHLMDIAENSAAAKASRIAIDVIEDHQSDRLEMRVEDNGCGMDAEMVAKVVDPFVTSRTTRKVGLGIPLLKEAAEACNGYLRIDSTVGKGTRVEVAFQHSHIDRMPLGNLPDTFLALIIGHPEIRWIFHYSSDGKMFRFDTQPIQETLDGVPLTEPEVLAYLRTSLEEGIGSIQ